MATLVAGGVGAAAGALIPGVGWLVGFQIASTAYSLYSAATTRPPDAEVGKLSDLRYTGSSYGVSIARGWGTYNVGGNVVWAKKNAKGEIYFQRRKRRSQGGTKLTKGQQVTDYIYSCIPAVKFAVGTIYAPAEDALIWREPRVTQIKANGKVTYQEDAQGNVTINTLDWVIYRGREDQPPDPTIASAMGVSASQISAMRGDIYGVPTKLDDLRPYGNTMPQFTATIATAPVTVGQVLTDLCRLAGLPLALLDFSRCTEIMPGFVWAQREAVQSPVEMICRAFAIDLVEVDGMLMGIPAYGDAPIFDIPEDWIGATENATPSIPKRTLGDEIDLPSRVSIGFLDRESEFETNVAEDPRAAANWPNEETFSTQISFTAPEALKVAMRENDERWTGDDQRDLVFPRPALALAPADRVRLPSGGVFKIRQVAPALPGLVRVTLKRLDLDAGVQPTVSGGGGNGAAAVIENVPGVFAAFAAPEILEEHRYTAGFYIAASGPAGWSGGVVYLLPPGATEWIQGPRISTPSPFGTITTALAAGSAGEIDTAHTVRVDVAASSQPLGSIEDAALSGGENWAWIGSEIVAFGAADLVAPGVYDLSHILRGLADTDSGGQPNGSRFVVASEGGVERIEVPEAHVGLVYGVKVLSSGQSLADVAAKSVTIMARNRTATERAFDVVTRTMMIAPTILKSDKRDYAWITVPLPDAPDRTRLVYLKAEVADGGGSGSAKVLARDAAGGPETIVAASRLYAGGVSFSDGALVRVGGTEGAYTVDLKSEVGFDTRQIVTALGYEVADIVGSPSGVGSVGGAGEPGGPGPAGPGVPTGGAAGQILGKLSGADFDTEWIDAPSGGGLQTTESGSLALRIDAWSAVLRTTASEAAFTEITADANSGDIPIFATGAIGERTYWGFHTRVGAIGYFSKVAGSGGAFTLEIWDGGAWVVPFSFNLFGANGGARPGTNWQPCAVNGRTLYWIRARVSAAYTQVPRGHFGPDSFIGIVPSTEPANAAILALKAGMSLADAPIPENGSLAHFSTGYDFQGYFASIWQEGRGYTLLIGSDGAITAPNARQKFNSVRSVTFGTADQACFYAGFADVDASGPFPGDHPNQIFAANLRPDFAGFFLRMQLGGVDRFTVKPGALTMGRSGTDAGMIRSEIGQGGKYAGFKAPQSQIASSNVWTLPTTLGGARRALTTLDGSGTLGFSPAVPEGNPYDTLIFDPAGSGGLVARVADTRMYAVRSAVAPFPQTANTAPASAPPVLTIDLQAGNMPNDGMTLRVEALTQKRGATAVVVYAVRWNGTVVFSATNSDNAASSRLVEITVMRTGSSTARATVSTVGQSLATVELTGVDWGVSNALALCGNYDRPVTSGQEPCYASVVSYLRNAGAASLITAA